MPSVDTQDEKPAGRLRQIRVWDLPTRLFHWLLVALFGFSWWTAETDRLDWHMRSGYAILALVLFRIYWGIVGSDTARFSTFLKGPKAFLAYAGQVFKRRSQISMGHNPMGGWSVAALIVLLLLQTGLGLFAIDVDGLNAGPLDDLVSFETGRRMAGLHHKIFNLLLILSALHIAAVLFYWVYKRQNLTAAMVTGLKRVPDGAQLSDTRFAKPWVAITGLAAAGLFVAWIVLAHH